MTASHMMLMIWTCNSVETKGLGTSLQPSANLGSLGENDYSPTGWPEGAGRPEGQTLTAWKLLVAREKCIHQPLTCDFFGR